MKAIKNFWMRKTYYWTAILWEGVTKVHWSKTESEALEWAACYDSGLAVIGKRNKILAERFCQPV